MLSKFVLGLLLNSISSNFFSFSFDACAIDNGHLDAISSINISLGNRVNCILGCVLGSLSILSQFWIQIIMTLELVVKNWTSKLFTCTLNTDDDFIITTNCIISVNNTFAFLGQTTEKRE